MATLVTFGDRLITLGDRESWLKRPSVPFATYNQGHLALGGDGRTISYLKLYETQPWVGVVVNKLNRQIIRLPLRLYREVTDDGECEPVYQHPIVDLLRKPWRRASPASLKQKMSFPALVHGNGLLAKVREEPNVPPSGFLPLDWRYVTPWCFDDGEVFFWETTQNGRPQYVAPEDVVHLAFEAGNGDLGLSPLKQLGTTLRTEDNAQRYQSASFENGARPSGALVLPSDVDLDESERQELREEIRAAHTGDRQFNLALLSGGMDWKPFSHTAVEAELIEQRKLNREEVAAVYDVDPPMIGILDHATYSNVSEMHKMLYGATLGPWLALFADTLNAQVIDPEPRWADERLFVAFDLTEVLKSNTPEEIDAISKAIGTGVMTPNEGRGRLRMRRVAESAADQLYMPTNNMTPLGQAPEQAEPGGEYPAASIDNGNGNGADPVKANLLRVMERAAKRMSSGLDPWDRDRFVRELAQDVPNAPSEPLADLVEGWITQASGDPAECRRLARRI